MKFFAPLLLIAVPVLAKTEQVAEDLSRCSNDVAPYTVNEPLLPDPFLFTKGGRARNEREWRCRRREISSLVTQLELGVKPEGNYNATLAVHVFDFGEKHDQSISFNAKIRYPTTGKAPYPAIIALGGTSLPELPGVATILFPNDEIAQQYGAKSRGIGKFYDLYGKDATAGAMMAWAWGVSRLIDALEDTPAAKIDLDRIGLTGCSRNGKGAFVAGAFDDRIVLTIPQEAGTGGGGCWRIADAIYSTGGNVQTASELVQENVWVGKVFENFTSAVTTLPFDHHSLAALMAPRGLFVIENDIDWLAPASTLGCMKAASKVWDAMWESDSFGYSMMGLHNHCSFPDSQKADLTAFVDKFLHRKRVDTSGMFFSSANSTAGFTFKEEDWIKWSVPEFRLVD
ncbi:hypothetical protein BJ875DRAFT_510599 [Amylocarpus encephaloides]|uniref:(4-O-methyl)-D-glucuronate--lignin esterase n=1 Tax=Amylocarpus encephaloides TaxID=45428 RepID=A0A9P7YHR3_9HELO|nr:hypothetical protein BJ875DRAFT_510599 [Amylocarpus encephaloides]